MEKGRQGGQAFEGRATADPRPEDDIAIGYRQDKEAFVISLVALAAKGNLHAFNRIVYLFQDDIYRMVFYRVRSRTEAEDITQDIFLKAFKSLSGLKHQDRFRSWLTRIALNKVRDYYRKKKVLRLFKNVDHGDLDTLINGDHSESSDAMGQLEKKEFWLVVESMMDKLPSTEREVFMLRFFDQYHIREIAEILKKTESTVKTHLYRALVKFRKSPVIQKLVDHDRS